MTDESCACHRITYRTRRSKLDGTTFGWWDCNQCGREFVAKASRDRIGHDFEKRLEEERAKREAQVNELMAERDEARTALRDRNTCDCGEPVGCVGACFACHDAHEAFAMEAAAKTVEAISAAINGPEQDALQWYARSALQRAAEAIRRGK